MNHRFLSIAAAAMLLVGCRHAVPPPPTSMPRLESLDTVAGTVFVPAMNFPLSDSCNVVYAPTLLYAWSDLTDQLPSPLTLPGERYLQLFAHAGNYKDALEKGEYTTTTHTSGNTVSLTASFAMRLPFTSPMDTSIMLFRGQRVKAFGMPGRYDEKIAGQITILYYENDDRFIISITPKNDNDLIILVKGFSGATFAALTESVSAAISSFAQRDTITVEMWKHELRHDDDVCIPAMGFNYTCHYKTFEGQHFSAGETSYQIKTVRHGGKAAQ